MLNVLYPNVPGKTAAITEFQIRVAITGVRLYIFPPKNIFERFNWLYEIMEKSQLYFKCVFCFLKFVIVFLKKISNIVINIKIKF